MFRFRKVHRRRPVKNGPSGKSGQEEGNIGEVCREERQNISVCSEDISFPAHLSKYIGRTVTIFTCSGGISGAGFTGVLMGVNACYVKVMIRRGPPPVVSFGPVLPYPWPSMGPCSSTWLTPRFNGRKEISPSGYGWGATAIIPVQKITAFSHSMV